MDNLPLGEHKEIKLGINDLLAMERTSMANERTFLAYIRTSITVLVPGITGVYIAQTPLLKIVASLFIPAGFIIFLIGIGRFIKKRKVNSRIKKGIYK